jgi:gamma-glutamylcysteine synthetase
MEQTNTGHTGFGLEIARRHADALAAIRIRSEDRMRLESCTHQSIDDQERLERESDLSFEEYLAQYLSTDPADDPPVS